MFRFLVNLHFFCVNQFPAEPLGGSRSVIHNKYEVCNVCFLMHLLIIFITNNTAASIAILSLVRIFLQSIIFCLYFMAEQSPKQRKAVCVEAEEQLPQPGV